MIEWLLRNLTRLRVIVGLLLTVTLSLAFGLSDLVRGATWTLLVPVTVLATLCGWGLGISRINGRAAYSLALIVGPFGVFAHLAGLIHPLGALVLRIPFILQQLRVWFVHTRLPDFTPLNEIWVDAAARSTALFERLTTWLGALDVNRITPDPVVAALVWSVVLWLASAWAGLRLGRTRQTPSAVAPAVLLLTAVYNYSGADIETLATQLGAALLLMGLARYDAQHKRWQAARMDFSDSIAFETTWIVGALAITLALIAAFAPSFSVEAMREAWNNLTRGDDRVARSLGLQPVAKPGGAPSLVMPGLPRSHLISGPPELLQETVMIVKTGELPPLPLEQLPAPPEHHYWRTLVYDVYIGTGWISSDTQDRAYGANAAISPLSATEAYRLVQQDVTVLEASGRLHWTGIPLRANVAATAAWRTPPNDAAPAGDLLGLRADETEYRVESLEPRFSAEALRAAMGAYPAWIAGRYLRLPDGIPERVIALARQITAAGVTPYDRARAIERYLRRFPYSLEVPKPPPGRDVADYFLFDLQTGYCDYYATSMVVLARAAGLPARLVIGYASGEYDAPNAAYVVRQVHSHSWVEVYFTGLGWVEFEPTSAYAEIGRAGALPEPIATLPPQGQTQRAAWLDSAWLGILRSLAGQIALAALIVAFGLIGWLAWEQAYVSSLSPERAAAWLYQRMEKHGGFARQSRAQLTPFEFAEMLSGALPQRPFFTRAGEAVQRVAALYVESVFGPRPPTRPDVLKVARAWNSLRLKLWLARWYKK